MVLTRKDDYERQQYFELSEAVQHVLELQLLWLKGPFLLPLRKIIYANNISSSKSYNVYSEYKCIGLLVTSKW